MQKQICRTLFYFAQKVQQSGRGHGKCTEQPAKVIKKTCIWSHWQQNRAFFHVRARSAVLFERNKKVSNKFPFAYENRVFGAI
jgi:hypothetical protein